MIAEPVSQMAGTHVPPPVYWERLREIADRYRVVLIADEVITGFGRLGEWFGMMKFGVQPDITTVAKAITSGYAALGAVIASKKIADAFIGGDSETFRHIITFGGLPTSCAAAIANLELMEREDLVGNTRQMGEYLFDQLQKLYRYPIVGDVRGAGLLYAIELVSDREKKESFSPEAGLATRIPELLTERGLTSFRVGNNLPVCPPLCVSKDEVDFIVNGIDETLGTIVKELSL
jgi:adenosylmethionine-8-amino-7-oxononanoate aminotransferase